MAKHTINVYWDGVIEYDEDNGNDIPESAGIYEILVKKKDEEKYIRRYIGQTNNLTDRFYAHLSDEEENEDILDGVRKYVCGFDYALIDSEADRKDAEQKLYDKYQHQWNQERPEGSSRDLEIEIIEHNTGN